LVRPEKLFLACFRDSSIAKLLLRSHIYNVDPVSSIITVQEAFLYSDLNGRIDVLRNDISNIWLISTRTKSLVILFEENWLAALKGAFWIRTSIIPEGVVKIANIMKDYLPCLTKEDPTNSPISRMPEEFPSLDWILKVQNPQAA
jgi:hypothetical protein